MKMKDKLIKKIESDYLVDDLASLIVNKWGFNLVAVRDIIINRQADGQLTDLHVEFIPAEHSD